MIRAVSLPLLLALTLSLSGCGPSREAILRSAPTAPAASSSFVAADPVPRANLPRSSRPRVVALSGGGPDGAFGAGYMVGLMRRADYRPADVVTGVSIGALVGAIAFSGDSAGLEKLFADGTMAGLGKVSDPVRGLLHGSIDSGRRYAAVVASAVDDAAIDRIAAEYRKGRRFYVSTTDIEAMHAVAWDMGAIAAQPGPEAKDFFRRVILASASIPGVYPPVPLADGTGPARLYVDGGATANFFVPDLAGGRRLGSLLIVINNSLGAENPLPRLTFTATAHHGFSSLMRSESRDLIEIEQLEAARTGSPMKVVSLPPSTPGLALQNFSASVMAQEFEYGRKLAAGETG